MGKGGGGGGGGMSLDPVKTAQQQMDMNLNAARESALLNQVNQWTPWGGQYWTGEIGSPDRTQHTVYNPMLGNILFGSSYHPHFGGGFPGYGGGPGPGDGGAWWRQPKPTPEKNTAAGSGTGTQDGPSGGDQFGNELPAVPEYDSLTQWTNAMKRSLGFEPDYSGTPTINSGNPEAESDALAAAIAAPTPGNVANALGYAGIDMGAPGGAGDVDTGYGGAGYDGGGLGTPGGPDAGAGGSASIWQEGGFTGLGDDAMLQRDEPAGTVHEGEFVLSTPMLLELLARPQNIPPMMREKLARQGITDPSQLAHDLVGNARVPVEQGLAALLAAGQQGAGAAMGAMSGAMDRGMAAAAPMLSAAEQAGGQAMGALSGMFDRGMEMGGEVLDQGKAMASDALLEALTPHLPFGARMKAKVGMLSPGEAASIALENATGADLEGIRGLIEALSPGGAQAAPMRAPTPLTTVP